MRRAQAWYILRPMVGFDIPYVFVAAGLFGWRLKGKRPEIALLYSGLGVAVPGLAYLHAYPDWDWQYFVDPGTLPVTISAWFALAVLGSGFLGHWVGSRSPKGLLPVAVGLAIFGLATLPRTLYVGTRAEFMAEQAELLPTEFLLFGVGWIGYALAVLGVCVWLTERAVRAA